MQNNQNCRGAKNRFMILMYITWLTLSLAPAMITPPERGFEQGQPEMQQAMDNMVTHKTIITKRVTSSSNADTDYHAVLTSKTSNLLSEAEKVLSSLPNTKETQWIEAFVQRMRAIAKMLERTAQSKDSPNNVNIVNGTPVPVGLPLQPTWPATSAVPGNNPFQKTYKTMSKFPVTSPELSKVLPANEYPSDRQAVTKPAVLSNNKDVEEDKLVKELESLHDEYSHEEPLQNSKIQEHAPVFTTLSTPVHPERSTVETIDVENAKAKLQAKLMQEIAEFQHLGGVIPSEVINALNNDNQKGAGLVYNQNTNMEDSVRFTEAGMVDRQGIQRFTDVNGAIQQNSKINPQNSLNSLLEKNNPYQEEKHLSLMKFNHSFQSPLNFHPNLQAYPKPNNNYFHHMSFQYKVPYQRNLQNGMQDFENLQRYNQGKYNGIATPTNQQLGHIPDALKQMLSKPQNNIYHGHLPSGYNQFIVRHGYGPYPYLHNFGPKNSTHHSPPMIPYYFKQPVNHQIDTQLSDEMKRELRDGKIIVLSDSVVRSNFDTKNVEKTTESTSDMSENKKNASLTEN